MKLLQSPNRWSCVPTSFAMVMDITVQTIVDLVKHDGSEKYWPELPDPRCRRGFHIQEMIDLCYLLGFTATPFQSQPTSISDGAGFFKIPETFWSPSERMHNVLRHPGVLIGETLDGQYHAVAWDSQDVLDPSGLITNIEMFQVETFWLICKIKSAKK